MKRLIFSLFLMIACDGKGSQFTQHNQDVIKPGVNFRNTRQRAQEALKFCSANQYSTSFCLLADMSVHSGVKRMMVWDFKNDTVMFSGLVSHGCCDHSWGADQTRSNPQFKNEPESYCSSLGKYKVGERGYSNWGIHVKYLLHGLEVTNNNALARQIVFHSWDLIADDDIFPDGVPEGWGCPAVSNNFMTEADQLLKSENAPVLFWIYQ